MAATDVTETPPAPSSLSATLIAVTTAVLIAAHLVLRFGTGLGDAAARWPLLATLVVGGVPFVYTLARKALRREFGADLLGGIAIVTSVLLGEYLAGSIIVLMLSGGEALETYAIRSASSVLASLAKRMPSVAHRQGPSGVVDVPLADILEGDRLVVYPHDICPVDGLVVSGHGVMDESYLTGEPFEITKTVGSAVISGAINGGSALTIQATRRAADSRYARIMEVMRESEQTRPRLRRMGDTLGALYTPVALGVAALAWLLTGDPVRFLSVLVIATPCPLLIAIPVAIIGSISLSARRAIIVKRAAALEQITLCRTAIFDKTGTLTYGEPTLDEILAAPGVRTDDVLRLVASLERYSKHPLAGAVIRAAEAAGLDLSAVAEVHEAPGHGLTGLVGRRLVTVTSRAALLGSEVSGLEHLPGLTAGLECAVTIDGAFAAICRFRDVPRAESQPFVQHLGPTHQFGRIMIVSGDRDSEVRFLAERVGITEIHAEQSPEAKLAIVRAETARARTLYVGDGINDAPAMMAATVGIAIGQNSDVTASAASVVLMDSSLSKVDEFIHIGTRMRRIALESALGGMALSVVGMGLAAFGYLGPVEGAVAQEVIDVLSVLNALRAAWPPSQISDVASGPA